MALPFKSDSIVIPSGGAADPRVVTGTVDPTSGFAAPEGSIYLRYVASNGQAFVKSGVGDTDWTNLVTAGGTTLDGSYDFGGPGAGRVIVADSGALQVNATTADTQAALVLNRSPSGAAAAVGLEVTIGANANTSSSGVQINDIGTGTSIYVAKLAAGIAHYTSLQHAGAQALVVAVNAAPTSASPVSIVANTDGTTATLLSISKIPGSSTAGAGIGVSMGGNTTGPAITISAAGTGPALQVSAGAIEMANSAAAVSPANNGRIRYNSGTQTFQVSLNGAAYVDVATGAGFTLDIGDAIGSSTVGSVLFVGAGNVLQQDNANFFWNDTNNALTVTTTTASPAIAAINSDAGAGAMSIRNTNANGPVDFYAVDSAGTARLSWGYGNASYSDAARVSRGYVWRNTGVDFVFARTSVVDAILKSDGKLGIGTATTLDGASTVLLHVNQGSSGLGSSTTNSLVVLERNTNVYLSFKKPSANEAGLLFSNATNMADGGVIYDSTTTVRGLQLRTGGNLTRMAITANGEVVCGSADLTVPSVTSLWNYEFTKDAGNRVAISSYGTGVQPTLFLYRGRGTAASTTAVQSGDGIGEIDFGGAFTTGDSIFTGTFIRSLATENWGPGATGAKMEFWTTPTGGGTTERALRTTIDQDGTVLIGAQTSISKALGCKLEVLAADATATNAAISTYGTSVNSQFTLFRGRGTAAATTAVLSGDSLGAISFAGSVGGTGFINSAFISSTATENWGGGIGGSRLVFTTCLNTTTTRNAKFAIENDGGITLTNSATAAASAAGEVRLRNSSNRLQVSENGGGYLTVASHASGVITGGIFFGNGSDRLAQDSANLSWDDTNNRLGVGTNAPNTPLHVIADSAPVGLFERSTTGTNTWLNTLWVRATTSGDMADGFGPNLLFQIKDSANVNNSLGHITCVRAGADNTGNFAVYLNTTGTPSERLLLTNVGMLTVNALEVPGTGLGNSPNIHANNAFTGQVNAFPAVYGRQTGSYDTTAVNLLAVGVMGEATSTRSAGAEALTNVGLNGIATGAQENVAVNGLAYGNTGVKFGLAGSASGEGTNWALYTNEGNVSLNTGNGSTTIHGATTINNQTTQKAHANFAGSGSAQTTKAVQTTDATQTHMTAFTIADTSAAWVTVEVVGRDTAATERAFYGKAALVYREGGGATIQGSVQDVHPDIETSAGLDATITVSGNDVLVSVTGLAATTINWVATVRYQAVSGSA